LQPRLFVGASTFTGNARLTPRLRRLRLPRILHDAQVMQLNTAWPAGELYAMGGVEAWMRGMIRDRTSRGLSETSLLRRHGKTPHIRDVRSAAAIKLRARVFLIARQAPVVGRMLSGCGPFRIMLEVG
jgi:hypothetical protein